MVVNRGSELSVRVRAGEAELVHEAQSKHVALRVFKDHRSSLTYTSDFSEAGLTQFVGNAVSLCRLAEPDPLNELPGRDELVVPADAPHELQLWDDSTMTIDAAGALQIAKECEAAALSVSEKLRAGHGSNYGRTIGVGSFACGDAGGILFVGSSRGTTSRCRLRCCATTPAARSAAARTGAAVAFARSSSLPRRSVVKPEPARCVAWGPKDRHLRAAGGL